MRILLDTHLLLWALAAPAKLPADATRLIKNEDIYVSAASIWEISIKIALGKMRGEPRELIDALDPAGFRPLAISHEHADACSGSPRSIRIRSIACSLHRPCLSP